MIRVLFICHGNICRSPMAEFILKKMVQEEGREGEFEIASAATSTEEIWNGRGNPVYPPAKDELIRHGFDLNKPFYDGTTVNAKRARQVTKADYEKYDYLICMDSNNVRNTKWITDGDPDGKIEKLLSYAGDNKDVSDPWYTDRFDVAYSDIFRGCRAFLEMLDGTRAKRV